MTFNQDWPSPTEAELSRAYFLPSGDLDYIRLWSVPPGPLDPDVVRGIERLTGEKYDAVTGEWTVASQSEPAPSPVE